MSFASVVLPAPLRPTIASDDPVIFFEPKRRYWEKGEIEESAPPLHTARVVRPGSTAVLACYGPMVRTCLDAAAAAEADGHDLEVIDLRTLRPLDSDTVIRSVIKTGRAVTVEEGWQQNGVGAEVATRIMEQAFDYLDAPVVRVTGKDTPMPYAANLEKLALPSAPEIVTAAKAVLYRS